MAKLRTSCDKIVSGISKIAFRAVFQDLNMRKLKPVAFRDKFTLAQTTRPLINKGVLKVKLGDYLTKLNLTSGGKSKQFFQLVDEVNLRWASKKEKVQDVKKCHSCNPNSRHSNFLDHLSDIKGLVYGKVTKVFEGKKNRDKEPWLCFSLILKNRSYDVFATEEQINDWVIGLSHLIKKYSPDACVVRPGQFFWKKLKMVMFELVKLKLPEKNLKKLKPNLSFVKVVNMYHKLMVFNKMQKAIQNV